MTTITLQGNPIETVGELPAIGVPAPPFFPAWIRLSAQIPYAGSTRKPERIQTHWYCVFQPTSHLPTDGFAQQKD